MELSDAFLFVQIFVALHVEGPRERLRLVFAPIWREQERIHTKFCRRKLCILDEKSICDEINWSCLCRFFYFIFLLFFFLKVNDKNELFNFLMIRLSTNPEVWGSKFTFIYFIFTSSDDKLTLKETYGIGRLLFEMFKGIKHQFNACTEQVRWNVLHKKKILFSY